MKKLALALILIFALGIGVLTFPNDLGGMSQLLSDPKPPPVNICDAYPIPDVSLYAA